jgi:hypothetical protein
MPDAPEQIVKREKARAERLDKYFELQFIRTTAGLTAQH